MLTPIITRVYTPEDYGLFTFYLAIASTIAVISTGRYAMAIVLPKKDKDAFSLALVSVIIAVVVTLVSLVGLNLFFNYSNGIIRIEWLYLIPLFILFSGIVETFKLLSNRFKHYRELSNAALIQSVSSNGISLISGLAGINYIGLILGQLLSLFFTICYLINVNLKSIKTKVNHTWEDVKSIAKTYKDMPLYNSLHALMDMVMVNGTILLLSLFFGPTVVGLYGFTIRLLKAPISLVGQAVSKVYMQKASSLSNDNMSIKPLFLKIITRLLLVSLPFFTVLFFWGEVIFGYVFGSSWSTAGLYAQILTPWLFFNFIAAPLAQTFVILGKQRQAFYFSVVQSLLFLTGVLVGGYILKDPVLTMVIISSIGSLTTIYFIVWLYKLCNNCNLSQK